ncbi:plasmid recombination protein [Massilia sp. UMI-21]|nr:plasmid recombination protein [Massilia sp. UMI-21]
MANSQFLRVKKLTGADIVEVAGRHNHREIVTELGHEYNSIDLTRINRNYVICGGCTAADIAQEAQDRMVASGIKTLRKDAVRALEIIVSLNPGSNVNERQFFIDATAWCESYFGAPVISAIVHLDEGAPHCHIIVLPLVNGRMIGSDLMGYKSKLQDIQQDFNRKVGANYGLLYSSKTFKSNSEERRKIAATVLRKICADLKLLSIPTICEILIELIAAKPERLQAAIGLISPAVRPARRKKTFVEIMTSPT